MDSSDTKNELPQLDTIRNIAEAEAYKEAGVEKQANRLRQSVYRRAVIRIAQEISKGDLTAYLANASGEFSAIPNEHEWMKQIRSFLANGVVTETQHKPIYNRYERRDIYQAISTPVNTEWENRLYIPVDAGLPVKQAPCDWGKHTTSNLEILKRAITEFWENHNPESPPKKETVVSWLEELKVSNRVAVVMDTIMRTEQAQKGGNKKERVTPSKPRK